LQLSRYLALDSNMGLRCPYAERVE